MTKSPASRVAHPAAQARDLPAARRRAASEAAKRQIDLEDWIAAERAREAALPSSG